MTQQKTISTVSFVGTGNVATHLAKAFKNVGVDLVEVYSKHKLNAEHFAQEFDCLVCDDLKEIGERSDLVIVSVPDSLISLVASKIKDSCLVVHTSGITALNALQGHKKIGVFYPLQTFSKLRKIDISTVPLCVEANNESDLALLLDLASRISKNVKQVNSDKRKILHLTAVMVSNFSNHMYSLAHEILEVNDIEFDYLRPLILETAMKIDEIHPTDAQTGPARRKDESTLNEHLDMLNTFPEYKEIYKLLSEQIIKKYHE